MKNPEQVDEIDAICQRMGISRDELADRAAVKRDTLRKAAYQPVSDRLMQSLRNVEAAARAVEGVLNDPPGEFRAPQSDLLAYDSEEALLNKAKAALNDDEIPPMTRAERAMQFLMELRRRSVRPAGPRETLPGVDPKVADAARAGSLVAMRKVRELKSPKK